MVAYLDSSALVKLAHRESHSTALVDWLNHQADLIMTSSALAEIELARALYRHDPAALPHVPGVMARLFRIEISPTIRAIAGAYTLPFLRTLDAIHLATAEYAAGVDVFVAYDARLLEFASAQGFTVVAPAG